MSDDRDSNGFLKLVLTGTCASLVSAVILHCCTTDGLQGLVAHIQSIIGNAHTPASNGDNLKDTNNPIDTDRSPNRKESEGAPDPELEIPPLHPRHAPIQFLSLPDPFLAQSLVKRPDLDTVAHHAPVAPDPAKEMWQKKSQTDKENSDPAGSIDSPHDKSGSDSTEEPGKLSPDETVPTTTESIKPIVPEKVESVVSKTTEPVTPQDLEPPATNKVDPIVTTDSQTSAPKKTDALTPEVSLTPEEKYRIARSRKSIFHWWRERQAYLINRQRTAK